jgi:hypothetical protein
MSIKVRPTAQNHQSQVRLKLLVPHTNTTQSATGKGLAARLTHWKDSMSRGFYWRRPRSRSATSGAPPHSACGCHQWCWPRRLILVTSLPSKTPIKHKLEQESKLTRSSTAKKATRQIGYSFRLIASSQWSNIYTRSVYAQPEQVKTCM